MDSRGLYTSDAILPVLADTPSILSKQCHFSTYLPSMSGRKTKSCVPFNVDTAGHVQAGATMAKTWAAAHQLLMQ